jgi:hypothetical protein
MVYSDSRHGSTIVLFTLLAVLPMQKQRRIHNKWKTVSADGSRFHFSMVFEISGIPLSRLLPNGTAAFV